MSCYIMLIWLALFRRHSDVFGRFMVGLYNRSQIFYIVFRLIRLLYFAQRNIIFSGRLKNPD